jgi:hypothetical protein
VCNLHPAIRNKTRMGLLRGDTPGVIFDETFLTSRIPEWAAGTAIAAF